MKETQTREAVDETSTRDIALIVEKTMEDFHEAMRLRDELSIRIGRRTSQIIRVGAITVSLLSLAIVYLTASLNKDMSRMLLRMDVMSTSVQKMESHVAEMSQNMQSLPTMTTSVTAMQHEMQGMNQQIHWLNGNIGSMGHDMNRMSAPMRMFPFN
ncbi:MAG: hypothetical protein OEY61_11725 [Gammaproteobacteria bacterium]|nr:hypothetical protein [Gammaproteobacteria bacterium]